MFGKRLRIEIKERALFKFWKKCEHAGFGFWYHAGQNTMKRNILGETRKIPVNSYS